MKKGIVAGLIVLCVALGAGTAAVVVTDDRKGPEIELPADGDVTYEEGSDTAPLLEGVTATDEKDGDVTDSLMIENIFPNDDHTSASVVYAAKDAEYVEQPEMPKTYDYGTPDALVVQPTGQRPVSYTHLTLPTT